LGESLNDDEPATFLVALRHVVMAHGGMAKIAKAANLNRESLYKALSLNGNPGLQTIKTILSVLGMKLEIHKAMEAP
jgi:probable addiction module antidote protein